MQLVDELSMIYTTCIMCFATFAFGRTARQASFLGAFLLALALFITGYYHYLKDPTFHQNAYAFLTAVVLLRCMYVMELELRPTRRNRLAVGQMTKPANGTTTGPTTPNGHTNGAVRAVDAAEKERVDRRDLAILHTMWKMVAAGLSIFLGGFLIWNLDNWYCSSLRSWRREIGLPWGILLEGHGWW